MLCSKLSDELVSQHKLVHVSTLHTLKGRLLLRFPASRDASGSSKASWMPTGSSQPSSELGAALLMSLGCANNISAQKARRQSHTWSAVSMRRALVYRAQMCHKLLGRAPLALRCDGRIVPLRVLPLLLADEMQMTATYQHRAAICQAGSAPVCHG